MHYVTIKQASGKHYYQTSRWQTIISTKHASSATVLHFEQQWGPFIRHTCPPSNRGHKHFSELAYSKHSLKKKKKAYNQTYTQYMLTATFLKNNPELLWLTFCFSCLLQNSVQAWQSTFCPTDLDFFVHTKRTGFEQLHDRDPSCNKSTVFATLAQMLSVQRCKTTQ